MTTRRGHNEGSIRQRPDGTWEARISLTGGRRKSFYGKTRRDVQVKLRGAQRDIEAGLDFAAGRLTVAKYLEQWLDASVKPSVKTKTYEGYESIARMHIVPAFGTRAPPKMTALDLQRL